MAQVTPGTGKQPFRNAPGRDVNHIGAEHRQQICGAAAIVHLGTPFRIGQIDPQRRPDICKPGMRPPRRDALEVLLVEIARPPGNFRNMAGEIDHVLAGAAARLHYVAGFPGKELLQHRTDRAMIAVKCRRVETTVGLDRPAILDLVYARGVQHLEVLERIAVHHDQVGLFAGDMNIDMNMSIASFGTRRYAASSARRRAVNGDCDAGFSTTELPVANAGAVFQDAIISG